jgi:hypothetical protein
MDSYGRALVPLKAVCVSRFQGFRLMGNDNIPIVTFVDQPEPNEVTYADRFPCIPSESNGSQQDSELAGTSEPSQRSEVQIRLKSSPLPRKHPGTGHAEAIRLW